MAPLRILISGAGVSGNVLVYWLAKVGHHVTVIERYPSLRTTGLQVDLRGHGIEVLKRVGIEEEFRSKSVPELGLQVFDSSGRRRAFFLADKSGKGRQCFTTDWEIMRGDFCRILHDVMIRNGAIYRFGSFIESIAETENAGLQVHFDAGMTEVFDWLVVADGQWSRTRKMMLFQADVDDGHHPLKDSYVAYFTVPRPMEEGEDVVATM